MLLLLGDTTVRIWDLNTETPRHTLKGHTNWVQIVAWSPNCEILVSGSMDKTVILKIGLYSILTLIFRYGSGIPKPGRIWVMH